MARGLILKLLVALAVGAVFASLIFGIYWGYEFYSSIFRLSPSQVSDSLVNTVPQCKKLDDCKLLPGDILIRRYITSKTWSFNEFIRPYFTHSAFYLGNDQLVEAVGTEQNHQDEIKVSVFSRSDWLESSIESFVVARPTYTSGKLEQIKRNLMTVAEDPNYRFGLPRSGYKQATCADLILKQLMDEKVVAVSNMPKIVTPDYLFWLAAHDPIDFKIIGRNI